jgi:hypothetical protein
MGGRCSDNRPQTIDSIPPFLSNTVIYGQNDDIESKNDGIELLLSINNCGINICKYKNHISIPSLPVQYSHFSVF